MESQHSLISDIEIQGDDWHSRKLFLLSSQGSLYNSLRHSSLHWRHKKLDDADLPSVSNLT